MHAGGQSCGTCIGQRATCPVPSQPSFLVSTKTQVPCPTCRLQASSSRRQQGITTTQTPPGCSCGWRSTALSSPVLKPYLQQSAVLRGRQELLTPPALVAAPNTECSGVPREASEALPLVPCPAGGMRSEHAPDPACRPSGKPQCCL